MKNSTRRGIPDGTAVQITAGPANTAPSVILVEIVLIVEPEVELVAHNSSE
jgi:hypothetical protein